MRQITILFITALLLTSTQPHPAAAESKFFKNLGDLFQGKNKRKKAEASRRDDRVAATQSHLNALGYDAGTSDGIAGRKTQRAISAFQQTEGFEETGKLTPEEFATLKDKAEDVLASSAPNPLLAQNQLTEIGFYEGEIDGIWGSDSQDALDDFRAYSAAQTSGPLNPSDMQSLQEAFDIFVTLAPEADVPFDTIKLFGNRFKLSQPAPTTSGQDWPEMKTQILTALPQSAALQLEPDAAQQLIAAKTDELSAAYQAQIDMLFTLLQTQIRASVMADAATDDVDATVAAFDAKIATMLIDGKAVDMIDQFRITAPGIAEAIALAQSTTHQMLALQTLTDSTISVTATDT